MGSNIELPEKAPETAQGTPQIVINVLGDGNLDLHINGLAPWAVIGICETVKNQMLGMTGGQQVGGLVRAPAGSLDHLGKGGRRPS